MILDEMLEKLRMIGMQYSSVYNPLIS